MNKFDERKVCPMSQHTEFLNIMAETLSPDDDNYEETLLEIADLFRDFGEALTAFLAEHGYAGDLVDVDAKAQFLREKFKTANVIPPRDFKKWFLPNARIERKTAYKICFAFKLDIPGTNDFFKCVQFERGFDCHTINEAVYYFCIKNGFSYMEAQGIIERIPVPKKIKSLPNQEILYTGTILENIDGIHDKEELIKYITDNIGEFCYNNATVIKYIQELWGDIAGKDGLAVQEGRIIDRYNQFADRHKKGDTDTRSAEVIAAEVWRQEKEIKPEDFVIAAVGSSAWTIFSQILGMRNYMESEYAKKHDRSITSVLSENALLPLNASYCFPSQHSIDKLLRGELGDNELMRKMLIFLVFYTYWAKMIVNNKNAEYRASRRDSDRCLETINGRLLSAGYPELYSGNPYDWLFMWSLNDEHPMQAFRTHMGEIFAVKEERSE